MTIAVIADDLSGDIEERWETITYPHEEAQQQPYPSVGMIPPLVSLVSTVVIVLIIATVCMLIYRMVREIVRISILRSM